MSIIITPPPAQQKGGAGSFETWQQVLDNGSVLDKANTIDGGGFDFSWTNTPRIASDGDLSLMGGNAGIFNDGSFQTYDLSGGLYTFQTAGVGDLSVKDKVSANLTLVTNGNGDLILYDKATGNPTFSTTGEGDLFLQDIASTNITMQTNGDGDFRINDKAGGGVTTLYTDGEGYFNITDKVSGFWTLLTTGIGDFQIVDKISNIPTISTVGIGDFTVTDKATGFNTFQVSGSAATVKDISDNLLFGTDINGITTPNESGTGISSPWLLGDYTAAVAVPDAYITVKVGPYNCKIPVETV